MKFRGLLHNYHDGQLASFTLGPRRELTLEVALDSVWNKGAESASVRFGGIENYDEVASFFGALPLPPHADAFIAEVIVLECVGERPDWVIMELAGHGRIKICSHQVSET